MTVSEYRPLDIPLCGPINDMGPTPVTSSTLPLSIVCFDMAAIIELESVGNSSLSCRHPDLQKSVDALRVISTVACGNVPYKTRTLVSVKGSTGMAGAQQLQC